MQRRFLIAFTGLAWPFLILLAAPGLQAPLAAHADQPIKPIKTWSALASWYGPGFQGKTTASGQTYDMFEPTAAHLWLPFGSLVRIVNSKTGRSQILRINDRGPFVDDRELDVSFLVASRLGLIDQGVGMVRLELLEEPKRP
jgi:rare lipoprotein A